MRRPRSIRIQGMKSGRACRFVSAANSAGECAGSRDASATPMRPPALAVALRAGAFAAVATLTGASVAGCRNTSDDTFGGTGSEGGMGGNSTVPDARSSDVGGDRGDGRADESGDDGGHEGSDGGAPPCSHGRVPHQARRLPRQREPHLRQLLREVPRRERRDDREDLRRRHDPARPLLDRSAPDISHAWAAALTRTTTAG